MLISVSVGVIILACILAVFLRFRGTRLAYVWFILFLAVFISLILFLILDPGLAPIYSVAEYYRSGSTSVFITFQLTDENRITGLLILTLVLAFLATETAAPNGNQSLYSWIEVLLFALVGMVTILAANAWTILITWALLDILNFISQIANKRIKSSKFSLYFVSRIIGSMILALTTALAFQANPLKVLGSQFPYIGLWALFAVCLHSGVFYRMLTDDNQEFPEKHFELIQVIIYVSHFSLLSKIPDIAVDPIIRLAVQILFSFVMIIWAFNWMTKENLKLKVLSLINMLAIMAGFLFISNNQEGIIYLLLALFPISWIILAREITTQFRPLWLIGLLAVSGLPFSTTYSIMEIMLKNGQIFQISLLIIPMAAISAGLLRTLFIPMGDYAKLDVVNQVTYLFGLLLPLLGLVYVYWDVRPNPDFSYVWAGLLQVALSLFIFWLFRKLPKLKNASILADKPSNQFHNLFRTFSKVLINIKDRFRIVLSYGASLFEETGGILWAIVFLSLILTIISSFGRLS